MLLVLYEKCYLSFEIWQCICKYIKSDIVIVKFDTFNCERTQNVLLYDCYLCYIQILSQKMELNRKQFRTLIFYNFGHKLNQQQHGNQLVSTLGDEVPSEPAFSLVFQIQSWSKFATKRISWWSCLNWYCKIVIWHIVRLIRTWALVPLTYIYYCMPSKRFVGYGIIWWLVKKSSWRLTQINV